jgi:hypothetical protein
MEDNLPYFVAPPTFNLEREYIVGDQVTYNGEIYLALRIVCGEIPGRSDSWTKIEVSSVLSESIYEELREQLEAITQNYNNTNGYSPLEYVAGGGPGSGMWEVTTGSNTSSSLSNEVAGLRAEIHTLRSEIAQIKRELKVVRAKEEKEHRKLSV